MALQNGLKEEILNSKVPAAAGLLDHRRDVKQWQLRTDQ